LVVAGVGIAVVFALVWLALAAFVFESDAYPAAWLRWRTGRDSSPAVDVSAPAQWEGGWDEIPTFWGAWDSGGGELQALPEEYFRLPLPRVVGEYVFIGGSLPWRGLDISVKVPNANRATLISEYWDGRGWVGKGGLDGTRRNWITLYHSGKVSVEWWRDWGVRTLVVEGEAVKAYWIRFSVTAALSEDLEALAQIIHNAPTVEGIGWELLFHKRTACQNRPGYKKIYMTVLDEDGRPLQGVKVGFDTEPSSGIVYDHPNFWGLTDGNGYLEWDHLGVPTIYNLFVGDMHIAGNIRTDFANEYCKPPGSPWWSGNRPVNRPGIVSWDLELRRSGN